jgi:hypothetical protein
MGNENGGRKIMGIAKGVERMKKPIEERLNLHAVDGDKLCKYIAEKINEERGWGLQSYDIYEYVADHKFGIDVDMYQNLFELIIEEEDYCNGDNPNDIRETVLRFIVEEFGGHFNINFLSMCAYL